MAAKQTEIELPGLIGSVSVIGPGNDGGDQGDPGNRTDPAAGAEITAELARQRAALQSARAALASGAAELVEFRKKLIEETDEQLFMLAMGIAKKVLAQEIQAGRYDIEPIVREALCQVPTHQDVVIRLNPADYTQCEMAHDQDGAGAGGGVRFLSDPNIAPAECLVETPEGAVDSSCEARLAEIAEVLRTP